MSEAAHDTDESLLGDFAPFGAFDPARFTGDPALSVGLDAGATLTKLCVRTGDGRLAFADWRSSETERAVEILEALAPRHLGLTGCGAGALAAKLDRDVSSPIEFQAWARGADEMLARTGRNRDAPYLLVAVGTGTSALRVDGEDVERMGGTALGGGAALGLGHALLGVRTAEELNALGLRGNRQSVDLMVGDLFEDVADVGAIIASSFGKLARRAEDENAEDPSREDLAAAVLGIVSDNIGLLASAYARAAAVDRIVYGGSTFLVHPQFADVARGFGLVNGMESIVLTRGGHAGCLGAMKIARREAEAA
ncbi:MAG: hypothetical protein NXI30_28295 [bacterium]|nr:hypothetical protein [bacterium]